ncbi:MAG: polysaccharide biosynthesis tyrosine autokinase [Gaiellaceae bacterium]
MDFRELVDTLWRRKLVVFGVLVLSLGAAVASIQFATKQYESRATLVLRPQTANDFSFFYALNSIIPIYASEATSATTYAEAQQRVSKPLAPISVETYRDTPIIAIKARDPDPEHARNSAQAVTDALLDQIEDRDVGIPSLRVNQIDRPRAASDPVYPRTGLTIAIAALLGLAFGVGAALLRESLSTRVETRETLAHLVGAPAFAEIPAESAVPRLRSPDELSTDKRLRAVSEALRDLRTNLLFSNDDLRSVVITSPEGSHGKTTVSVGLAATFARAGTRTVLVDGDLRKGRVAEMLRMPRSPGLLEALKGTPVGECVQETAIETLDLLPGGALEADPSELLMAEFPSVLHDLKGMYEVIVVDTTPLVPVNDARIIASSSDAVLIVANAESVTRRQVKNAVERLTLVSVAPTAAVLNNSRQAESRGYYGYLETPKAQKQPRSRRLRRREPTRRGRLPI